MISIHDDFETMKTLLRSDDLAAKETFLKEVVTNLRLDLINLFLEHNLINNLTDKLLDHVMIEAIKIPSIPLITTLYSKTGHNNLYVIMASLFKKPEAILFFGVHGSTSDQDLALVFLSKFGHLEDVKTLLNLGIPFHPQAFVAACENGHLDIIHFLKDRDDIDLTYGLCGAVEYNQLEVVSLLLNLNEPIDYVMVASTAACYNRHDLLTMMLTLAQTTNFDGLSSALEHACSEGYHKIIRILLNLNVPLDPKTYLNVHEYDIYVKSMVLSKLRFSNLSSRVTRNLIPDLVTLDRLKRLQRTWRRRRLNKASLRMNLIKDELQAVFFSPERLYHLLPQKVTLRCDDSIRRAVISLRLLYQP